MDLPQDIDNFIDKIWNESSDITKQAFPCHICSHIASNKGNLRAHIRGQHEGSRFECKQCSKIFNYSSFYKLHMRRQHNIADICIVCNYNAPSQLDLKMFAVIFGRLAYKICTLMCLKIFKFSS